MRNHHQNAAIDDLRTERSPWNWNDLFLTVLALAFVFGVYAMASDFDERADQREVAFALAQQERMAMPAKVAEAYERGLTDAIAALRDTPDGVALAQACMAQGAR